LVKSSFIYINGFQKFVTFRFVPFFTRTESRAVALPPSRFIACAIKTQHKTRNAKQASFLQCIPRVCPEPVLTTTDRFHHDDHPKQQRSLSSSSHLLRLQDFALHFAQFVIEIGLAHPLYENAALFFEWFLYACPEHVLAKSSFLA
jgi:hypothetical protein